MGSCCVATTESTCASSPVEREEVSMLTAAELPPQKLPDTLQLVFIERDPCACPLTGHRSMISCMRRARPNANLFVELGTTEA